MKAWMLMRNGKPFGWQIFANREVAREAFLENVPTYVKDVKIQRVEILEVGKCTKT